MNLDWITFQSVSYKLLGDNFLAKYFDWLVQERRNSIASALDLRYSCTNPSIWIFAHGMGLNVWTYAKKPSQYIATMDIWMTAPTTNHVVMQSKGVAENSKGM